nr:immunoglobulin heavy chain junction region [Mus musculus]
CARFGNPYWYFDVW